MTTADANHNSTADPKNRCKNNAAVLGHPISHSLSPVLHNAAYKALGISKEWNYEKIDVTKEELEVFLISAGSSRRGLSLTMPLKKEILKFARKRGRFTELLGVANTVVFDRCEFSAKEKNGSCKNNRDSMPAFDVYNTDVEGIVRALRPEMSAGITHFEKIENDGGQHCIQTKTDPFMRGLVVGNGATAESAVTALRFLGCENMTVVARNVQKAARIMTVLAEKLSIELKIISFDDLLSDYKKIEKFTYAVSTVPAYAADIFANILPETAENSSASLLDVVYDPRPSKIVSAWKAAGYRALSGESMLLRQAVGQVALMTGISAKETEEKAFEAMKTALIKEL